LTGAENSRLEWILLDKNERTYVDSAGKYPKMMDLSLTEGLLPTLLLYTNDIRIFIQYRPGPLAALLYGPELDDFLKKTSMPDRKLKLLTGNTTVQ